MSERMPFVVDDKWVVWAGSSMEAAMTYRREFDPNRWPVVRQADPHEVAELSSLAPAAGRHAA